MTYFQNLNRLILKELELRADHFVDFYDPAKRSIILIPGGMGSKLMQCNAEYAEDNFPGNPAFREIWLSWPAILFGKVDELGLDPDELDHDERPIIASGEMNSIVKSYDGTEAYFIDRDFNYTEFGYDWRRDVSSSAAYLKAFLGMIKNKARLKIDGQHNALRKLTLFAHSMGGLVVKILINDLIEDGEDCSQWFHRFVSVASPFYGTETHIYRYYRGEKMVNLLLGSTRRVAEMVATLPGPYGLLPCPLGILEPVLDELKLNRYPVRDAEHSDSPIDPFSPAGLDRFPEYTDMTYFARAGDMFSQIGKKLPDTLYDRIFHIRNNIRNNNASLEWTWRSIDRDTFEPGDDSPISANGGASDGTVPFWSARLTGTPEDHIHSLSLETDHGSLAEDERVLGLVRDIAGGSTGSSAAAALLSGEGPIAPLSRGRYTDDIAAMIEGINSGHTDNNTVSNLSASSRRALVSALAIC